MKEAMEEEGKERGRGGGGKEGRRKEEGRKKRSTWIAKD